MKKKIVFCVLNFKGGVGKSTISSIVAAKAARLGFNSAVFNIAKNQPATKNNPIDTVDFNDLLNMDSTTRVEIVLEFMKNEYDFIFIDTPGELSEEFVSVINQVDVFIVPFESCKDYEMDNKTRGTTDTLATIESIFTSGIYEKNEAELILLCNKFQAKHDFDKQIDFYRSEIGKMETTSIISLNSTKLSASDAIQTIDISRKDIDELTTLNKAAYNILNMNVEKLVKDIFQFSKIN